MKHFATSAFWDRYRDLPAAISKRADKQFALLKADAAYPSLKFKKVGERQGQELWSARVTLNYRALALRQPYGFLWFWIGDHTTYDALISRAPALGG